MIDMRAEFARSTTRLMHADDRLIVVLAEIGRTQFADAGAPAQRVLNVGIREQLMVGVAAGLGLVGFRPVVHTIASFAVERPYEQLKVDLGHQGIGAIVVAHGASYDYSTSGRTHHAPEDVALIDSLPDWSIYVPGHPDEVAEMLGSLAASSERAYVRLAVQQNVEPHPEGVIRVGKAGCVLVVGPLLDRVLEATSELDISVVYLNRVRPLDVGLIRLMATQEKVALIEPFLEGTSIRPVTQALNDTPHRFLSIGVKRVEHRGYGTVEDLDRANGLDAVSLRDRLITFFRG